MKQEILQQLLDLTALMGTVRGRDQLLEILCDKVKPVFPYDDPGLFYISDREGRPDPKGDYVVHMLDDIGSEINKTLKRKRLTGPNRIKGSPAEVILSKNEVGIWDLETLLTKFPNHKHVPVMLDHGLKEIIAGPIYNNGEKIGFLCFNATNRKTYHRSHFPLFRRLCYIFGIAVSNILAFEEIYRLKSHLEEKNRRLVEEIKLDQKQYEIVGESRALKRVFEAVETVAPTPSTVLLTGETGTGKELFARAIHYNSARRDKALVKVNCATLPPELVESELFGHRKGSFTGAVADRIGKFELADGGTIFLDEIGELPLELQPKLLRAIQEGELEKIGGKDIRKVDVRIIAATNRNLKEDVETGRFRSDLFYRLNVFPIHIPPLRDRKEDISPLAHYFLKKSCQRLGREVSKISSDVLKQLMQWHWPGNVRELEHVIERAVIMCKGTTLNAVTGIGEIFNNRREKIPFQYKSLDQVQVETICATLKHTGGRIRGKEGAAEILRLKPTTLEARMKKLGVSRDNIR